MELKTENTSIDEAFIRNGADRITDADIQRVNERSEEIKSRFLGEGPLGTFVEELFLALRLTSDYVTGRYQKIPYWAIGAITFMFLYLANPMDLIPDFIIGLGQIDDLAVVSMCLILVRQEIHVYKAWRAEQTDSP